MSPIDLLRRLREQRVEVFAEGDRLRVRAPEGALTDELRTELAASKAAILSLLKQAAPAPEVACALTPVRRSADAPLSFTQERFWFLEHLEKGTSAYHLLFAVRIRGTLDAGRVRTALQSVIRRHAGLRTSFVEVAGSPRQVVANDAIADLRIVDLQAQPEAVRQDDAMRIAREAGLEPFDLQHAPLMRNVLIQLGADDALLVFAMHHIVSDGWSVGVLVSDFAAAYRAQSSGAAGTLPEPPLQYADFALRQRDTFAAGGFAPQIDYWRRQLADLPTLQLPSDRPRPAARSVRGAEHTFLIGKPLSDALAQLSRREGVTLFMTLFAGFQALLHRYSQQDDIVTGTAIAGRTTAEFEQVVGPFINTLVLRTRFPKGAAFREIVRSVRDAALEAYANQDVPFERLVDELQAERDLSRNPLCQVIFALQNVPAPDVQLDGLRLGFVPIERTTAALDMDWMVYPTPDGLYGTVRYSTDLFDAATIARMARHYERLLESAVAAPETSIAALSLVDERERRLVTSEWNDTARAYPDSGIADLFEQQVRRRPAAIAISGDAESLTYAQLNERANRLAHYLIRSGVGPDTLVGVFHERSVDAIVALVAIVKAGGAYLPLDPAYPEERLALMLGDARPGVVLTRRGLIGRLPNFAGRAVALDDTRELLRHEDSSNPERRSTPDTLAYVTYTSGSTGVPKGVEVLQRGVTRLLFGVDYVRITEDDCFLQLASISFDASTFEVWGALLHGARLAVLDESVPPPDVLGEVLQRHGVSIMWLTASFFNAIVDARPDVLSSLRQLLIGGEALSVAHVRRAQAALPGTQIINGYGPTESTTFTCCYPIPALPDQGVASIPIGRPIANTTVYVLDSTGRPSPVGVPGELHIGGDGLARGYLNHPALTAERFIPDPFSARPEARLYRTGDIVRYLSDGLIQFLGRNDDQVKIRGFRVEPGEVEQVLREHAAVGEAAVIVQEQSPTSRRLVAYVTPAAVPAPDGFLDEVKQFAQRKLPSHMVPAAFVALDSLPLTPHGKLDRRALPDPEPMRRDDGEVGSPQTAAERTLADVWARVLRLERVGTNEDFFELGGDSILSLQVVAGAREQGLKITPRQIFECPTVAELARVAEIRDAARKEPDAASRPVESGDVPLTPVQRWFFDLAPEHPEHFNHAVMLRVRQPLDSARLRDAVAHVIARHDALRLRFERNAAGNWRQWYSEANDIPEIAVFDLSLAAPHEHAAAIERHASELQASFDLTRGPIVGLAIFDLGPAGTRLLVVVHHLAIDVVSWGIVLADLQDAYEQLGRGTAVTFSGGSTSFGAWSQVLRAHAEQARAEAPFWGSLGDAPVAPCPLDGPGGSNTFASERTVDARLDADGTHALLHEVPRKYGMRIHEVLLAALAGTFAEWTKNPALLVDVEGHGREAISDDADLTRSVGWFTTIYPVLLDLARTSTIDDRLKRVKEQLRRTPNNGIGYGVLRYLSADAAVRRPLEAVATPDVAFNYLGQVDGTFAGGLFAPAADPTGPVQAAGNPRAHVFEVSARVLGGQLHVAWHYSEALHSASTVERLTRRFLDLVREVVAHCRAADAAALTPSDFPEANVSQDELDRLLARIGEVESKS